MGLLCCVPYLVSFVVGVCALDFEGVKREIEALVVAKGFYNTREDVSKKLLFAFIELGEAVAEELVDVVFYVLDASRLACPSVNTDEMFRKKLEKNRRGHINRKKDADK